MYRLLVKKQSWDDTLTITMKDPQKWQDAVKNWNGNLMCHYAQEVQIETDTSAHGRGTQVNTHHATGTCDYYTSRQSSNFRELTAVWIPGFVFWAPEHVCYLPVGFVHWAPEPGWSVLEELLVPAGPVTPYYLQAGSPVKHSHIKLKQDLQA